MRIGISSTPARSQNSIYPPLVLAWSIIYQRLFKNITISRNA